MLVGVFNFSVFEKYFVMARVPVRARRSSWVPYEEWKKRNGVKSKFNSPRGIALDRVATEVAKRIQNVLRSRR